MTTLSPTTPVRLGFHYAPPRGDLLERAMIGARRAVGSHGIVARCQELPPAAGVPRLSVHVAVGPKRRPDGRRYPIDVVGTATSSDGQTSWLSAVAEALERYCFVSPPEADRVIRAPFDEVAEWAVPLTSFGFHSAAQYEASSAVHLAAPAEPIDWTWAYSLTSDRFALVPASLAFATVGHRPPNNFIRTACSTGLATHVSVPAALLAGVYEVVERDALMLAWLHRREPARIVVDNPQLLALIEEQFGSSDVDLTLLDLTADTGIPTVGCLAFSADPSLPAAAFGSAARSDPVEAARKAVFEAGQIVAACQRLGWTAAAPVALSDVRSLDEHARYYASPAGAERVRFFAASQEQVGLSDLPSMDTDDVAGDLAACVGRLDSVGLEVLAVDVTTPDVAACGFHTFKVVVPGAVDINGDVRHPYLGSSRITTVPTKLGWAVSEGAGPNLQPCPLS